MGLAAPLVLLAFAAFAALVVLAGVFGLFAALLRDAAGRRMLAWLICAALAICAIAPLAFEAMKKQRASEEARTAAIEERQRQEERRRLAAPPSEFLPKGDEWDQWGDYLSAIWRHAQKGGGRHIPYIFILRDEFKARYPQRFGGLAIGEVAQGFTTVVGRRMGPGEVLVVGAPNSWRGENALERWFKTIPNGGASGARVILATRGKSSPSSALAAAAERTGAKLEYMDAGTLPPAEG